MIWLVWRQFRVQAAVIYGAVAVLAAVLAVTRPHLVHLYHADGNGFLSDLGGLDTALYVTGTFAVLAVPVLIGMFWGAPLAARELEAGTHRLAWTMAPRIRWLAARLGLIGAAAMVGAGLLSLVVTWWAAPIDQAIASRDGLPGPGIFVMPRMSPEIFGARGIAALGYAAFAFVLGVAIGSLARRALSAMAILLAVFVTTQVIMTTAVRPNLMSPVTSTTAITSTDLTFIGRGGNLTVADQHAPGAWVTSQHTVGAAGQAVRLPSWALHCPGRGGPGHPQQACFARLDREGYRQQVSYQPASRFWPLQAAETAIYLVLALLLAGVCVWRVRRLS